MNEDTPLTVVPIQQTGIELAATAQAAAAKARIEAAYIVAIKYPRHTAEMVEHARAGVLAACRDSVFAGQARYEIPFGDSKASGWTIRAAEEFARCWGNMHIQKETIYEDELVRRISITVTDLESNLSYTSDTSISKAIERKHPKDREILSERENTQGKKVFTVKATEGEVLQKDGAFASRHIRNNIIRLIPSHILKAAEMEVRKTLKSEIDRNPLAAKRKVIDGFLGLGLTPFDIEQLGFAIDHMTDAEIERLRGMYQALKDGAVTYQELLDLHRQEAEGEDDPPPETPLDKGPASKKPRRSRKVLIDKINALGEDDPGAVLDAIMTTGQDGASLDYLTLDELEAVLSTLEVGM